MRIAKCEILWQPLQVRCIIIRNGQEETFAFGEFALWIEGLFIAVWGRGLLSVF
jgi:hypothetical protein